MYKRLQCKLTILIHSGGRIDFWYAHRKITRLRKEAYVCCWLKKNCIDKYEKYAGLAKDDELKQLFEELKKKEQEHYKTIGQILNGEMPSCDCNDTAGKDYQPKGSYSKSEESEDKKNDCFLATDSIGTEKLVSGEYNSNVFACTLTSIRKVLADIEIEEQNHAEMLYKYKMANGMQ